MAHVDAGARAAAEGEAQEAACAGHAGFQRLEGGVRADQGGSEVDRAAAGPGGCPGQARRGIL